MDAIYTIITVIVITIISMIVFFIFKKYKKLPNKNYKDLLETNILNKQEPLKETKKKKKYRYESSITLEDSWKFLVNITEKVLSYFSESDKDQVKEHGKRLSKAGAIYNHVLEYGVSYETKREKRNSKTNNKSISK